ncbi:uncharacterized protein EI90DRAFT_3072645 [Cantharellus anzutake]|uniref:uncharacterized protein n=1 Tax=Cantharellus anzutake TaxID=1750568 RepID=UPI0019066772|nr:uncharacterized protein EI90DRAFT_3072645 [Cantharellus anzutake]KAF8325378.1 hypothetical protein EI90DRAFT_3072645 [Cantharellus anzutake]
MSILPFLSRSSKSSNLLVVGCGLLGLFATVRTKYSNPGQTKRPSYRFTANRMFGDSQRALHWYSEQDSNFA